MGSDEHDSDLGGLNVDGRPRVDRDYSNAHSHGILNGEAVGDRLLEKLLKVHKRPRADIAPELKSA